MSGFVRTVFLVLCLQQISLATCAAVGLPKPGLSLSGDDHRHPPSTSFLSQQNSSGHILPLNGTASDNLTDWNLPAKDRRAYCRDDFHWFGPSGDLDIEDCQKAILSIRNDVQAGTNASTSFTWTYPGYDSRTRKFTPRLYDAGNCVLSVWPRYLAEEDPEIGGAQPQGLHQSDVASLNDIGALAFRVYDQCIFGRQLASAGWIPAGERSSLFVGFWEKSSEWDNWAEDLQLGPPPVTNGVVATT